MVARYGELADGRPARVAGRVRRARTGRCGADPGGARARARLRPASPDQRCEPRCRRLVELIAEAGRPPRRPASSPPGCCCRPWPRPVTLDAAYDLLLQDTEPSWLTMVDAGRHDRLGAVERRRRRRGRARVAQPLQQGRGDLVPAPLRRRPAADGAGLPHVPGAAAARWRADLGEPAARQSVRPDRGRLADSTASWCWTCRSPAVRRPRCTSPTAPSPWCSRGRTTGSWSTPRERPDLTRWWGCSARAESRHPRG